MKRVYALAAAVALAAAGGIAALVTAGPAHADTQICDQFGSTTIASGKYVVMNNRWGDNTTQCINVTSTGFTVTQAAHNQPQNGAPGAYPAIYAGCHYANCSTGSGLPLQVSNSQFQTIQTSVSMTYPSNGSVFDASYDIWFDPTPRTDGQNTGAELMVWLNHTGSVQPVGSKVGTANIAGGTWDVWEGNSGWNVISYVRQQTTSSASFSVSSFWNDVVSRGFGSNSWYITSVQAGFEPWVNGTGLAVNNFSYSIGGNVQTGSPTPVRTSSSPTPIQTSPSNGGSSTCHVTYTPQQWQGGFTANLTINNTGTSALSNWTVKWTFPGDQKVTSAWNATVTQSGSAVTATNMSYNGSIPPGGNQAFGFQGTWSSSNASPTAFSVNGTACS